MMDKNRLKQLAGLKENVDVRSAISIFEKLSDGLNKLQDEAYDMDSSDRQDCLELIEDVSNALKELKTRFAKYL